MNLLATRPRKSRERFPDIDTGSTAWPIVLGGLKDRANSVSLCRGQSVHDSPEARSGIASEVAAYLFAMTHPPPHSMQP
jgi:hypothetical protein